MEHQHVKASEDQQAELPRRGSGTSDRGRLRTEQCDARDNGDGKPDVGNGQQIACGCGYGQDAVPYSQQSEVEGVSRADKESNPKDVAGFNMG